MSNIKYTFEVLSEAVANSTSFAGVIRHLGLRQAGGTQTNIIRRVKIFGIDISHFTGSGHTKGKHAYNRLTAKDILVALPEGAARTKSKHLRRALAEVGVPLKCSLCPIGTEWNGLPITLEIDHIDGDWLNNLQDNVRFLCPNCHSQQTNSNMPHKYRV